MTKACEQLDTTPEEMTGAPVLPRILNNLWRLFLYNKLDSYTEIASYINVTGSIITPFESDMLIKLDNIYKRESEWRKSKA